MKKGVLNVLYLSGEDIKKLVEYKEVIEVVENAMHVYETGDFVMPDRITVNRGTETYLYMPCFTDNVKGTKVLTLYEDNAKKGEPTLQGVMLLNDIETGKIECIMEGSTLTAYRTGAVGATGIKHTTPEDVESIGIIGTGVQGYYQSLYACSIRNIKTINIFNRTPEKTTKFKSDLEAAIPNIKVNICDNTYELVKNSDIIITATTSNIPVIPDDKELLKGKHFIGVGSYKPTMQEYPQSLFEILDDMYIDVDFAKEETGDLVNPLHEGWIKEEQVHTLGNAIKEGKIKTDGTTLYKSVGMALFDTSVGAYILKKAKEKGIGTILG
jgi:ornithine cyclodeaminase/alanine dehydrogenase-like protein (mu-crystallin family)